MGLNQERLGVEYPATHYKVERDAMLAYARATNEDNPLLVGDGAQVASPMFGVVWLALPMMQALFDPELIADANLGRMVHAGQDMRFLELVRPGDELETRTKVAEIEEKSSGELLQIQMSSFRKDGRKVLEATASCFFRGPPDPDRKKKRQAEEWPEPWFTRSLAVDADQTLRYAEASGDHNPIHTDEETARMMGFDGIIVHGMCTMALAQKAILDGAVEGQVERLARLKVQFAKPVYPGDTLDVRVWKEESEAGSPLGFVVLRGQEVAIREGLAEIR
ncbi:MAG: MaoC family dehydratase N-terminal domain-containing protein [Deltaproteobacteria bacterium]|nr:MaoC family dehydratase N-terminal domain-containing protein [Deltaproteobacteria bacterium]